MEKLLKDENYENMIIIHGHLFELDTHRENLIEFGNKEKQQRIDGLFISEQFIYGWFEGNQGSFYGKESMGKTISGIVKPFKIPKMVLENVGQLTSKEVEVINRSSISQGQGFILIDKPLAERLQGHMPRVNIAGHDYLIDISNLAIKRVADPSINFAFGKESLYSSSERYYNTVTNLPVNIGHRITVFPENIVCIKFPPLKQMDIVGYSTAMGESPTNRICYYPWLPNSDEIKVTELINSKIPELVRRNQVELEVHPGERERLRSQDLSGRMKGLKKIGL